MTKKEQTVKAEEKLNIAPAEIEAEETIPEGVVTVAEECPLAADLEAEERAEQVAEVKALAEAKGVNAEFFYNNVFKIAFNGISTLTHYESLKITEIEEVSARATSDELFKLIENTPALGFMMKADWIERYSLVVFFTFGKVMAFRAEYKAKHPKEEQPTIEVEAEDVKTSGILG